MTSESDGFSPLDQMRAKTAPPGGRGRSQFPGMREYRRSRWRRVKGRPRRPNCFHVMSRIVDGLEFFSDQDKEALVVVLFKMARFCRIKVLTYCVMGNHFHALIEVPDAQKVRARFLDKTKGWDRLYSHLSCLYSRAYVAALKRQVDAFLEAGRVDEAEEIREAFLSRMGDLSRFMWELKERYTKWYNKSHGRRGALWMGRFKSVLVEGDEGSKDADGGYSNALRTMAAYIDLNPVRAGLVQDPADYPWCGYASALASQRRARRGLNQVMGVGTDQWEEGATADRYRRHLFRHGLDRREASSALKKSTLRKGIPAKKRRAELSRLNAKIRSKTELQDESPSPEKASDLGAKQDDAMDFVRQRMGALSRGFAVGSKAFVEEVFESHREYFGEKRQSGGRATRLAGIYALRKIQQE